MNREPNGNEKCRCGHTYWCHYYGGRCAAAKKIARWNVEYCGCRQFRRPDINEP